MSRDELIEHIYQSNVRAGRENAVTRWCSMGDRSGIEWTDANVATEEYLTGPTDDGVQSGFESLVPIDEPPPDDDVAVF